MRIFLTGGTGYIGEHIVLELLRGGHEITLLTRDPSRLPHLDGVNVLKGSVEDLDLVRGGLAGHHACIHNAIVWGDGDNDLELRDVRASAALFDAAGSSGVQHIIYTSSTAVHRPFRPKMNENDPLAPTDMYAATKVMAENLLSAMSHKYPMRCNVIRPGPVIGLPAFKGFPVHCDRRFRDYLAAAQTNEPIKVENDARQFIAVGDLAKLYAAVIDSNVNREIYLGVAANSISWRCIAETVVVVTGSSSTIVVGDPAPPHSFDVSKIERAFGLRFDTEKAIRDHIEYLASNSNPPAK